MGEGDDDVGEDDRGVGVDHNLKLKAPCPSRGYGGCGGVDR